MDESLLLRRIESFMRRHGLTAPAFGRESLKDSHLVYDLRQGRELRRRQRERVLDYMASYKPPRMRRAG